MSQSAGMTGVNGMVDDWRPTTQCGEQVLVKLTVWSVWFVTTSAPLTVEPDIKVDDGRSMTLDNAWAVAAAEPKKPASPKAKTPPSAPRSQ